MLPLSNFWHAEETTAPLTDDQLRQSEADFGVTFPNSLVEVLRLHNGGAARGACLTFLPLDDARSKHRIRSLTELAQRGEYIDDEALDEISQAIGDPRRIIVLSFDGAYCIAMNFNANGPHGEPTILSIDLGGSFMFGVWQQIAATFQEVVDQMLGDS